MKKYLTIVSLTLIVSIFSCTKLKDGGLDKTDLFPKSYFNPNFLDLDSVEIGGKILPTISGDFINGYLEVYVLDKDLGLPVNGAKVTVETNPNSGVTYFCNSAGLALIKNTNLRPPLTITATSLNYENFSILNLNKNQVVLYLSKKNEKIEEVELSGKFTGWSAIKNYDGILDAGFMIPSIDLASLVAFNLKNLLAPNVTIDIFGDREVPGNLVLPTQTEQYLFFDVKFSKPSYIFPLPKGSTKDLIAISTRIPFRKFIDAAKDGLDYSQLTKLIKFDKIGVVRDFYAKEKSYKDIALTNNLNQSVKATVSNSPAGKDVVLLSTGKFVEKRGSYFPISFNISENASQISANLSSLLPEGNFSNINYLYGALGFKLPREENEEVDYGISGEFKRSSAPGGTANFSTFFKVITQKSGSLAKGEFSFISPKNEGISPDADFYIAKIFKVIDKKEKESIWTLIMPKNMTTFNLPLIPVLEDYDYETEATVEYFWSVSAYSLKVKSDFEFSYDYMNQEIFEDNLSHISQNRSSLDKL